MLKIRRYTEKDIEQCIDIVKELEKLNASNSNDFYTGFTLDENKLQNTLYENVNNVDFFCNLIVETIIPPHSTVLGGMCAYVASPMFSSEKFAYDQILYTVPSFRHRKTPTAVSRLIETYIQWAKQRKVKACYLRSATLYKEMKFTKLCQRAGFVRYETGFAFKINTD